MTEAHFKFFIFKVKIKPGGQKLTDQNCLTSLSVSTVGCSCCLQVWLHSLTSQSTIWHSCCLSLLMTRNINLNENSDYRFWSWSDSTGCMCRATLRLCSSVIMIVCECTSMCSGRLPDVATVVVKTLSSAAWTSATVTAVTSDEKRDLIILSSPKPSN